MDGGAWLSVDGQRVDWIYRDLDRVHRIWRECRAGRFEVGTQAGHPLGVYSHAYVGELAMGQILADPSRELATLQDETRTYPQALRAALVANARWQAPFTLAAGRKAAYRGDAFYVAGCLFRVVGLLVQALHAQAECWVVNEKGAVQAADALAVAPEGFAARAHGLLGALGITPDSLNAALSRAEELADDVWEQLE